MRNSGTLIYNEIFFGMKFPYMIFTFFSSHTFPILKGKERYLSFEGPCSVIIKNLVYQGNFLELVIFIARSVRAGCSKAS